MSVEPTPMTAMAAAAHDTPAAVEIAATAAHRYSLLWLHGLGADGNDFVPLAAHFTPEHIAHTRFIFPHAPPQPVTINGGMMMRAWYDIATPSLLEQVDHEGLRRSAVHVSRWLRMERARGIPYARMLLGGFSQGGALALHTALGFPHALAGVVALSAYLPTLERFRAAPPRPALPIFMAHGDQDAIVDISAARRARDGLRALGHAVCWRRYAMTHEVCMEEMVEVGRFADEALGA